ncbi:hypothetical protein [Streptomyces sp. NPDC018031]|uniref:hypothetical protein n=1 Tax=Streptomyces sp. NPDC018031 TaxID=3365033 RepID=UPI00379C5ACB
MIAARWRPPTDEATAQAAGEWWDAVRVPADIGARALDRLGDDSGAVISDGWGRLLYWLIPPGTAEDWRLPRVQVLGRTAREMAYVGVPPAHRQSGPALHWRIPPTTDGRWLTEPEALHTALTGATAELSTADPDGAECSR